MEENPRTERERRFLGGLTLAWTAGLLGLHPRLIAAEPPPETTTLRLIQPPCICQTPYYLADTRSDKTATLVCRPRGRASPHNTPTAPAGHRARHLSRGGLPSATRPRHPGLLRPSGCASGRLWRCQCRTPQQRPSPMPAWGRTWARISFRVEILPCSVSAGQCARSSPVSGTRYRLAITAEVNVWTLPRSRYSRSLGASGL
jgi:hypothetical protein